MSNFVNSLADYVADTRLSIIHIQAIAAVGLERSLPALMRFVGL